ncbi:MAG: hypothetical protein IVW36_01760 [Dehalococcoidia bacterium]|nr:hypothetical protein [Dehalococcoidia bacterium]
MDERRLESVCRECGKPLSFHAGETAPARCPDCFDGFLRLRDADFLSSYAELGVASRRIIAETSLRALVMESPPHRKVLAMHIMEQYVQAASDLVGLYHALQGRLHTPVMRAFLDFQLDRTSALAFFHEIRETPGPELLDRLLIPQQAHLARSLPSLSKRDVKDLDRAIHQMLIDLRKTVDMGETAALALAQMAGERRTGAALTNQSAWLDITGLRADQVAAIALDERRRTVSVTAISVDEKRLQTVVGAIDAMTRAAQNMIYAVLSVYQEEARSKALNTPSRARRRP